MDAIQSYLLRFMEGSDKRFVIPVYQRNYDWKKEQCETLMEDLISIYRNNIPSHFFGSIVFVGEELASGTEFCIIDGQQRLTTISLLLLAIYNYVTENNIETQIINPRKIKDSYLVDEYAPDELKLKLKLAKNDKDAYEKLFSHDTLVENSSVTGNYNYFYTRISHMEPAELDKLFSAIQKLIIVKISINPSHGDDPQLIFESLNSTGLGLEEADKVRNFILMGLNSELQTKYYNEYWAKIETLTSHNVSTFLRYYLAIKEQKLWQTDKLYKYFKTYVIANNLNNDISILLKDLLKYANYYNYVINTDDWIGLDEDNIDYTGKSICQYKFLTELTPISDWTSMYKDVCKSLFLLDRSSFISFVNADFPENKTIKKRFNTTNTGMRNPFMVDSDVYIELNLNTQTKIEMLRVLFAHFNIDFQDLSFKLKATSENE